MHSWTDLALILWRTVIDKLMNRWNCQVRPTLISTVAEVGRLSMRTVLSITAIILEIRYSQIPPRLQYPTPCVKEPLPSPCLSDCYETRLALTSELGPNWYEKWNLILIRRDSKRTRQTYGIHIVLILDSKKSRNKLNFPERVILRVAAKINVNTAVRSRISGDREKCLHAHTKC